MVRDDVSWEVTPFIQIQDVFSSQLDRIYEEPTTMVLTSNLSFAQNLHEGEKM